MSVSQPTIVLFAGADPGGTAGIAADLQTCWQMGARSRPIVCALTAQADGAWIGAWPTPADLLKQMTTGLHLPGDGLAFKAGMLGSIENARILLEMRAQHAGAPLVVDPLRHASSGGNMWPVDSDAEVLAFLRECLLPGATAVTPNWPELAWLSGQPVLAEMADAETALRALPCPAVLKGGHAPEPWVGIDWLWDGEQVTPLPAEVHWQGNVRGTGCRFATALAVGLATGMPLGKAARTAKREVAAHALAQQDQPL